MKKFVIKGTDLKIEQIRIFCIIFGGITEPIYDFCNLLKITNKKFTQTLKSNKNDKASIEENSYAQKFQKILSENGKKILFLDKYLYCESGPTERLCEMGCYLIENDYYLRKRIYDSLPLNCKTFLDNVIKISIFNLSKFIFIFYAKSQCRL